MKKILLSILLLTTFITLTACQSANKEITNNNDQKTVNQTSESTFSIGNTNQSDYTDIISQLRQTFNPNLSDEIDISVEDNAAYREFPEIKNVIEVSLDDELAVPINEAIAAIENGTATVDQKEKIMTIRRQLSDIAKKLPNDLIHVAFVYETEDDFDRVVAISNKNEDLLATTIP
ncbi:hypothetical protein [Streptococcus sp. CSL10205-OR2]|uniref:hypothetical protein n=1 Tax=Streptococcus sp. CSL10205-OR2 TaxID=2980558 RepID=UPI0021DA80D6|nr:hypothetical protein [Streptococcus sp. CSL10205-OR2]MCU9534251.1 hypothetical protein [Streptococcus sp. CSL10205-OR2]